MNESLTGQQIIAVAIVLLSSNEPEHKRKQMKNRLLTKDFSNHFNIHYLENNENK